MAEQFGHCVLYHRDKEPQLVTTEEQYLGLMAEGGWESTPAAFGVITAPSTEQRAQMPALQPTSPLGATRQDDSVAFAALLQQWQFQMNEHRGQLQALQATLAESAQRQDAQQQQGESLRERLQAVEQWMVRQPSTPATRQAPPAATPKGPPSDVMAPTDKPDTPEKPESSAPASAPSSSSRQERK